MPDQLTLSGLYNSAVIYTAHVDDAVIAQVKQLLDEPFVQDEYIAIMPDTHIGKGAVIGTTMTIKNKKVCPNLVGVDIGCGIMVTEVDIGHPDRPAFEKLDQVIRKSIPSGFSIHQYPEAFAPLSDLTFTIAHINRIRQSLGTLGGGNHFIELGQNDQGQYFLAVHTGSRNLGLTVATYHQKKALDHCRPFHGTAKVKTPSLSYLEGAQLNDYLNDLAVSQQYAHRNRELISDRILSRMNWQAVDRFDSVHNYIDLEQRILRKGATDASKGKKLIIPLNMKDGSLMATGKGNPEWNYSAPHGAGRLLSRRQAKKTLSFAHFKEVMQDVYSTSIRRETLDEAPMAYKKAASITDNISETVTITARVRPVYNFKSS